MTAPYHKVSRIPSHSLLHAGRSVFYTHDEYERAEWREECEPVADRIVRFAMPHLHAGFHGRGADHFVLVSDETLQLDQALATAYAVERELRDARTRHERDVRLLREELSQIRALVESLSLGITPAQAPSTFEFEEGDALVELERSVERALRDVIENAFVQIRSSVGFDEDLGGKYVSLDIWLKAPRSEFRSLRQRARDVFDDATRDRDTSRIVVSVHRRD